MVWTGRGALFPEREMICAGGDHNFTGFDKTPNPRTIDVLSSMAIRAIPRLASLTPTIWTGLRPATPDSLPIIGYSERLANTVVATGYFHEGFTTSAITGEIVAGLITKEALISHTSTSSGLTASTADLRVDDNFLRPFPPPEEVPMKLHNHYYESKSYKDRAWNVYLNLVVHWTKTPINRSTALSYRNCFDGAISRIGELGNA
jgi:FAD dependent oxidoreductase